ncbi:MAG: hypothetical protein BRC29_01150 [Nanohaloarchaea archaeon SW_7_43_1]|nr:MAG: hypothetical protein BRC29_01150 [Nanohaloarchaea archaeon SW_7_43_1]
MKSKKLKAVHISATFTLFLTKVSAQIIDSSGRPEDQLLEVFNQILLTFEAQSISEVFLFFILPLFGFYFINKNIFEIAFENFHERIDRHEWHNTDDELPTGVKGLAFVVAFMVVQITGAVGTWILVSTAALAFGAWVLSYMDLLNLDDLGGEGGNETVAEDVIRDAVGEGEDAIEDTEEDEDEEDVPSAENDFEHALSAFEGAEEDLIQLLEYDEHELLSVVQRANDAVDDTALERDKLSNFEDRMENFQQKLINLSQSVNDDADGRSLGGSDFQDSWQNQDLDEIMSMTDQIIGHIVNLRKLDVKNNEDVRDELDDLIRETKRINRLSKFLNRLDHDLSRLSKDEQRLEQIVEQGKEQGVLDDNFVERLMGDKRKMSDLASNLEHLEDELDTVMPTLKKLIDNLEEHVTIEEDVLEDLIEGGSNVVGIEYLINSTETLAERVNEKYSDVSKFSYKHNLIYSHKKLKEGRTELVHMKDSIESGESEYVSRRLGQLKQEYSEITND